MTLKTIETLSAPAAIGPYSQGVIAGDFLFVSGQIPIDPVSGQMVTGSIEAQTTQVLQNLKAIVEAADSDLDHVAKTTVYLTDMGDFQAMNSVYARYFSSSLPARAAFEVSALPKNAAVEIEAVVCLKK